MLYQVTWFVLLPRKESRLRRIRTGTHKTQIALLQQSPLLMSCPPTIFPRHALLKFRLEVRLYATITNTAWPNNVGKSGWSMYHWRGVHHRKPVPRFMLPLGSLSEVLPPQITRRATEREASFSKRTQQIAIIWQFLSALRSPKFAYRTNTLLSAEPITHEPYRTSAFILHQCNQVLRQPSLPYYSDCVASPEMIVYLTCESDHF
jgi:hypothetical protein